MLVLWSIGSWKVWQQLIKKGTHDRAAICKIESGAPRCAVPDSQWTVSDLLADGDRVAARTTWSGTYQAPEFRGVTVPGPARFAVEHVHVYRISDGKMIEHWVVRDDLTMLRQLGAIPTRTS